MDAIESKTCMRFVDINQGGAAVVKEVGHAEYVFIVRERSRGCCAMIGYHKELGTPHTMNLESPMCLTHQGTIQHELLHVVGILHEQARYDRDNAVIIYWENIDKGILSAVQSPHLILHYSDIPTYYYKLMYSYYGCP